MAKISKKQAFRLLNEIKGQFNIEIEIKIKNRSGKGFKYDVFIMEENDAFVSASSSSWKSLEDAVYKAYHNWLDLTRNQI